MSRPGSDTAPQTRIGDAERDQAVHLLGEHYAAGRLTKDEYDERVDAAWTARTRAGLDPLFWDLPAIAPAPEPRLAPSRRRPRRSLFLFLVVLVVALAALQAPWWVWLVVAWMFIAGVSGKGGRCHSGHSKGSWRADRGSWA